MSKKKGNGKIIAAAVIAAGMVAGTVAAGIILPQTNYVNITCYGNNGTVVEQRVRKNSAVVLPTPERDGFNFDGWYLNEEMTDAVTYGTKFNKNTKVYAGWELTANALADDATTLAETTGITKIGAGAFKGCTNLIDIVIPETIMHIGKDAFSDCVNLTNITFRGEVAPELDDNIFDQCSNLELIAVKPNCSQPYKITLPNYIDKIVEADSVIMNPQYFTTNSNNGSAQLKTTPNDIFGIAYVPKEIKINNQKFVVDTIGESAFANRTAVTNILLPASLTTIGVNAFNNCVNLNNLLLGENVTSIGTSAFYNCGSLTEVVVNSKNAYNYLTNLSSTNDLNNATTIKVLTSIDDNADSLIGNNHLCSYIDGEYKISSKIHNYNAEKPILDIHSETQTVDLICNECRRIVDTQKYYSDNGVVTTQATYTSEGVRTYTRWVLLDGNYYEWRDTEAIPMLSYTPSSSSSN